MGEAKVLSFFLFGGIRVLLCFAALFFSMIAAWRHRSTGLWILAAAVAIVFAQNILSTWLSSPWRSGGVVRYINVMGYLSFASLVTTLIGWCVLAFKPRK